ncbi:hypothetical protein S40285_06664 [Stachybotrys chlorohalonatus IBT 40285]|uniref:N-acetyltransferase domain-containing protein n=1 Tax=Stachybotrys chlorohalonatus (strain IBT 40285) TaxID=1283841 RepID=A0A084QX98_STAC4|nr:hypothetical protein S40285_06664 [Stachybotrys chlorohalonata IBT 40285]
MAAASVKVRRAVHQDIPHISDVGSRVFSSTFGHSVTPAQMQDYLDEALSVPATTAELENPQKDMIVAVDPQDNTVLGFGLLTRGSSEPCVEALEGAVELQRIYVDNKHHGKGVGKLLILELEQMARDMGFKHIWLGVWEENHKAQKVYEKAGYKLIGEHDFDVGGDIQTDLIMFKQL